MILLLFIFLGCAQTHVPIILTQDYNFLSSDSVVSKLRQRDDTLYKYSSYTNRPYYFQLENSYKIIDSQLRDSITILKIKRLEASTLITNAEPEKRYSLMVFKNIDNKHLGYLGTLLFNLTRDQLDTLQIKNLSLENKNFLTYFSDSYIKELSTLKKITTKNEIREVINTIQGNDLDSRKISYSAEQLNKACIIKGYNPVGAGLAIDSLMKK